jgi:peroxiredoxin
MLQMMLLVSLVGPPAEFKTPAPEFNRVTEWVNSKPLKLSDLRGKVVVVHFFAFG